MSTLDAALIGTLYRAACLAELDALKPGNVHAFAAGHRMVVADFITSADVSAPALAQAGAGIGARIRDGVAATMAAVARTRISASCCSALRSPPPPSGDSPYRQVSVAWRARTPRRSPGPCGTRRGCRSRWN